MSIDRATYLRQVREQYENFPYPPRDPAEEKDRLLLSYSDLLPLVNQYCFKARRDFTRGFRVLVAGSGTGDVEVFFGEQLHGLDAEVVAIDISAASIDVAKKRAALRGLNNIRWIHGSLLDLPKLGIGEFDYISSTGVLHHLADPSAGLRALRSVLRDDGAMGIMVYGRYGRTAVYQMQDLLRMIDGDEPDVQRRIDHAKALIGQLPKTNWFARSQDLANDHVRFGDSGIYDLFLHSQDRAYTVPEVYDWVEECDLELVAFGHDRVYYDPRSVIRDPDLLATVLAKPKRTQQAIAEMVYGNLFKHFFYCARSADRAASLSDEGMVPFLWTTRSHQQVYEDLRAGPGASTELATIGGAKVTVTVASPATPLIFKYMDGKRTVPDLVTAVTRQVGDPAVTEAVVQAELENMFYMLSYCDHMLLRHESLPPYSNPSKLQDRAFGGTDRRRPRAVIRSRREKRRKKTAR